MNKFIIESKGGEFFGTYEGETAKDAFLAMLTESGDTYGDPHVGTEADWIIEQVPDHIPLDSPRAQALRDWLNERHKVYSRSPITTAQLAVWLDEAEVSGGIVEIKDHDSVNGHPETFRV